MSRGMEEAVKALLSIGARASAGLAQLFLVLAVAHALEPHRVAFSIGAIALANLLAVAIRLGADNRYLVGIARSDRDLRADVWAINRAMILRAGILVSALAFGALAEVAIQGHYLAYYLPIAVAAAPLALCAQYQLVLASLGRPVLAPLLCTAGPIGVVILCVLSYTAVNEAQIAWSMTIAFSVFAVLAAVVANASLQRSDGLGGGRAVGRDHSATILAVIQQTMVWAPTALAAATLPSASVAAIAVAFRIGGGLTLGTNALASSSLKLFADLASEKRWQELSGQVARVQQSSAALAAIGVTGFLILLFGFPKVIRVESIRDGIASAIIVAAYVLVAFCGPLTTVLVMLGRTRAVLASVLVAVAVYGTCMMAMWVTASWSAIPMAAATLAYAAIVNVSNARDLARWRVGAPQ